MAWKFGLGPCGCCGNCDPNCGLHTSYSLANQLLAVTFDQGPDYLPPVGDGNSLSQAFLLQFQSTADGQHTYTRFDNSDGISVTAKINATALDDGDYGIYTHQIDELTVTTEAGTDSWTRDDAGVWSYDSSGPAGQTSPFYNPCPTFHYRCTSTALPLSESSTASVTVSGYDYSTCSDVFWFVDGEGDSRDPNGTYSNLNSLGQFDVDGESIDGYYVSAGLSKSDPSPPAEPGELDFIQLYWLALDDPNKLDDAVFLPAFGVALTSAVDGQLGFIADQPADYFAKLVDATTFPAGNMPVADDANLGSEECCTAAELSSVNVSV